MTNPLSGEFNFIPLDKIRPSEFEYPETKNAKPLLGLVEYPIEFQPAFKVSNNIISMATLIIKQFSVTSVKG